MQAAKLLLLSNDVSAHSSCPGADAWMLVTGQSGKPIELPLLKSTYLKEIKKVQY